jgi:hypothetical protein
VTEADRRKEAGQEADAALERANAIVSRGAKIAQGWTQSRKDNNFRLMIRQLGQRIQENGT